MPRHNRIIRFLTQKCPWLAGLLLSGATVHAELRLPAIFGSHMVLQQNMPVKLWGWGAPNDDISISCSWLPGREFKPVVQRETLRWQIDIPGARADNKPQRIVIDGGGRHIVLDDLLFGEVWLCSGQSNMEWQPSWGNVDVSEAQFKAANDKNLRFFTVQHASTAEGQDDCEGQWQISSAHTMRYFSATAYFFGRELRDRLGIPVGLINASWGGTPIESWMDPATFQDSQFASVIDDKHPVWNFGRPGSLFNGMIAPLTQLPIKGFLWYQGETNTHNPEEYTRLLERMATEWRAFFGHSNLPFYYVQIAPFQYRVPCEGAAVQDAQRRALQRIQQSGMVVTNDIGDLADIHPRNKTDVGKRLAAWALTQTYGLPGIAFSGPLLRSFQVENGSIRAFFDFADEGLRTRDGQAPCCFEIAGEDRRFYPAKAVIEGNTIVASAAEVPAPLALRYAFFNEVEPNLVNAAGLPASGFRTDDWRAVWPPLQLDVDDIQPDGTAQIRVVCNKSGFRIRQTLDGTDPTPDNGAWVDSEQSIRVGPDQILKARVFDAQMAPSDRIETFRLVRHLASGRPVETSVSPSQRYPGCSGSRSLTDGLHGDGYIEDKAWQGYEGEKQIQWTIDLGETRTIKEVSATFLVAIQSWVFPPKTLRLEISVDGKNFKPAGKLAKGVPGPRQQTFVDKMTIPVHGEARFIRLSARALPKCPDWHPGKGQKAWLFVDEIVVK